ncbi:MAG: N-acetyltransferase [Phycisphaerales bacterium]|nr:N-acetyltransferase [Phycisphaerales bacterium]
MTTDVTLRDVIDEDLPIFFDLLADPLARHMAAFVAKDPADRAAFDRHWAKIVADSSVVKRSVLVEGRLAGQVLSYEAAGERSVCYWFAREHWAKGVATRALAAFLAEDRARPLHARAARDNGASIRVLEKCGFVIAGQDRAFANARGAEIEEVIMVLT